MAERNETVYFVPDQMEEIQELGGAMSVHEAGGRIEFTHESLFLNSISSLANTTRILSAGAIEQGIPRISQVIEVSSEKRIWSRIDSSARMIGAIAAGDNAVRDALLITGMHLSPGFSGEDANGVEFSATDPDLFAEGWMPILDMMDQTLIGQGASYEDRCSWYQETRIVFQCFGVDDECIPDTYDDYKTAWQELLDSTLQQTPSIERLEVDGVEGPDLIPDEVWESTPAKSIGDSIARFLVINGLPGQALDTLGYEEPSRNQRRLFSAIQKSADWLSQHGPVHIRHHPYIVESIYPVKWPWQAATVAACKLAVDKLTGNDRRFDRGVRPAESRTR